MVMSTGSYTYMMKLDSSKQLSVKCVDKWYLCSGNISVFYMPGALYHTVATQYKYNRNQFSDRRPALWRKIKLYEACKHKDPVPILLTVSTDAHPVDAPFSAARIHAGQNEKNRPFSLSRWTPTTQTVIGAVDWRRCGSTSFPIH